MNTILLKALDAYEGTLRERFETASREYDAKACTEVNRDIAEVQALRIALFPEVRVNRQSVYQGKCNRCGHVSAYFRAGENACKWVGCNGIVAASEVPL